MVAIEINSIVRVRRSEVDLNRGGCQMYVLETAVVGLGNFRYDGGLCGAEEPSFWNTNDIRTHMPSLHCVPKKQLQEEVMQTIYFAEVRPLAVLDTHIIPRRRELTAFIIIDPIYTQHWETNEGGHTRSARPAQASFPYHEGHGTVR